jgi:hypothetical protein
MKNILFLIVLLFSSCALRPEKLIGTYSGTCDGTPVSIKLPENGLWQLSKDTIIIFCMSVITHNCNFFLSLQKKRDESI